MITELDVDVLPLTKEGQVIGTGMSDPQFQLEEFKTFLDPYRSGLPDDVQRQLDGAIRGVVRASSTTSGTRLTA